MIIYKSQETQVDMYEIKVVFDRITLLGSKVRCTNKFFCAYDTTIKTFTEAQGKNELSLRVGLTTTHSDRFPTIHEIIHSLLHGVCDSLFEVVEVTHNIPDDILDAFSIECLNEFL